MDGVDPGMPTHKRLRLDSVNPGYHNGLPPPTAQPTRLSHHSHPSHPTHPIPPQAASPSRHHYPPHSLPPPSQPYSPNPGHQPAPSPTQPHHHYGHPPPPQHPQHQQHHHPPPPPPPHSQHPPQPSPSQHPQPPPPPPLPSSTQSQPPQHPTSLPPSDLRNLVDPTKVPHRVHGPPVISSPSAIPQDSISTYRPPPTPQYTSAPEVGPPSRTASVSDEKDSKPPMAHGGPPSPWQVHQDHRNGHSMSNGYAPAISPPIQNEPPAYHTPPLQPYGQQPSHSTGGYSTPYMNQYAPGPGQMRRKQVRATQACNHCRSRKQKCDEARPCQFCRENNFDCQYKDVPVPKQDRTMMQLQESVNSQGQNITQLQESVDSISKLVAENTETMRMILNNFGSWKPGAEPRLPPRQNEFLATIDNPSPARSYSARNSISEQHAAKPPTPMQPPAQYGRTHSMKAESPITLHSHASPHGHSMTPVKQESNAFAPQPPTPAESVDQSPDPGALDTDHATPAHKLLPEWAAEYHLEECVPALRKLVEAGKEIIDYPIHYEQERGLLRVWGVGEGHDSTDGVQGVASPGSQTEVDSPSPASITGKDLLWGHPPADHSSPSTVNGDVRRDNVGLLADGKPDFRWNTLQDLVKSYHRHIHVLHPVLNLYQLDKMVKDFAKLYSPDYNAATSSANPIPERLTPGLKRKRSGSMFGDGSISADELSKIPIERSLRNAIVLLVLALGKVSAHSTTLPSPQGDRPLMDYSYSRDSPYSTNHSFRSDDTESRPRNIDILPGMIYYAYATDILGNQQGGNTVAHAQAMILASLYLAQYGRVLESWSWINNACRIALVLIQADYPRINRDRINRHGTNGATQEPAEPEPSPKERHRLNMVKIIYWTCLSLETDIRAEMSTLPSTRVSHYQSNIIYPAGVHEHFPEVNSTDSNDENLFIYTSLMHVRVLLNGAHISLYGGDGRKSNDVLTNSKHTAALLTQWRAVLPPLLTWRDEDPPSTDPNLARVRAKVHGAMYVVLRPCLFAAIQLFKDAPYGPYGFHDHSPASSGASASTPVACRGTSDLATQHADLIRVSTDCIRSAIQSTIAFDRIGADPDSPYRNYETTRTGRLILTNIVGTLHAQFGNMIVLAAVWSSRLRSYLPQNTLTFETLSRLFHRTMKVLEEMAPNSPILKIDWETLNELKNRLHLHY